LIFVSTKSQTIEIDEATATALKERAAERGMSVPDLLAQYVSEDRAPIDGDHGQLAELNRRWSAIEAGQPTVPHNEVVRWLETWGTATFKPWRKQ
jgi:predicted transcriptional regulator